MAIGVFALSNDASSLAGSFGAGMPPGVGFPMRACTVKRIRFNVSINSFDVATSLTLYKNGVATPRTIVILPTTVSPAAGVSIPGADVAYADGDKLDVVFTPGAPSGNPTFRVSVAVEVAP